jgi:hypothetical protein
MKKIFLILFVLLTSSFSARKYVSYTKVTAVGTWEYDGGFYYFRVQDPQGYTYHVYVPLVNKTSKTLYATMVSAFINKSYVNVMFDDTYTITTHIDVNKPAGSHGMLIKGELVQ